MKQEIIDTFLSHGFKQDGDNFYIEQARQGAVVINGQVINNNQTDKIEFRYIGEGSIHTTGETDEKILYGFQILHNNTHSIDVWLNDEKDLGQYI